MFTYGKIAVNEYTLSWVEADQRTNRKRRKDGERTQIRTSNRVEDEREAPRKQATLLKLCRAALDGEGLARSSLQGGCWVAEGKYVEVEKR